MSTSSSCSSSSCTAIGSTSVRGDSAVTSYSQKNKDLRPIWGVLTQPTESEVRLDDFKDKYHSYIPASFVRWLECGGARVIPIRHDIGKEELRYLFESINGVLLTGGELADIPNTPYGKTVKRLFKWAIKANDARDHFPMYGTCQGFQLMCQMAAKNFKLKERVKGCVGVSKPLEFTSKAKSSRIMGSLPDSVYHTLGHTPCAEHMHNYCITPKSFEENHLLNEMFEIVALNKDDDGKVFVSCVESKQYPFWAGQFHPERNAWEWCDEEDIDHSPEAVIAMQHLATFLVGESQKSNHRFKDTQEERKRVIYNSDAILVSTEEESRMYTQTYFWANHDDDVTKSECSPTPNEEVVAKQANSLMYNNDTVLGSRAHSINHSM